MCSKVDQSIISKKRKMPESVWKPISSKKPRYINSDSSQKALNAGRYITFYSLRNGNLALRPNGLPFDLSYFDVPFHRGTIVSLKNNCSLKLEDFLTLANGNWLSTSVVDYVANELKQSCYVESALFTANFNVNEIHPESPLLSCNLFTRR